MAEPFVGEIRIFAFGTIPNGWIPCNGQILQIRSNQALFALLYTTYGGDGKTTFAVPDLRGRVPIHPAPGIAAGKSYGEEVHVLTENEMPMHYHLLNANKDNGTSKFPKDNVMAATGAKNSYAEGTPNGVMNSASIANVGASTAHNNMQPYLTFSFCIATIGIFPPRP